MACWAVPQSPRLQAEMPARYAASASPKRAARAAGAFCRGGASARQLKVVKRRTIAALRTSRCAIAFDVAAAGIAADGTAEVEPEQTQSPLTAFHHDLGDIDFTELAHVDRVVFAVDVMVRPLFAS